MSYTFIISSFKNLLREITNRVGISIHSPLGKDLLELLPGAFDTNSFKNLVIHKDFDDQYLGGTPYRLKPLLALTSSLLHMYGRKNYANSCSMLRKAYIEDI